jgi:hypothetical protein
MPIKLREVKDEKGVNNIEVSWHMEKDGTPNNPN